MSHADDDINAGPRADCHRWLDQLASADRGLRAKRDDADRVRKEVQAQLDNNAERRKQVLADLEKYAAIDAEGDG